MDPTTTNDHQELEDICPFGDIVLLVGPKERRLRVSSHCLRVVSKVFNVMLGPRWTGADDQKDSSEARLPEDDSKGMRLFCAVIHYRHDLIPEELPSRLALKFAVLVDKYDAAMALSLAIPDLMARVEPKTTPELAHVAAASMIFDDDYSFQKVCKRLVFRDSISYLDLHEDELLKQWLPFTVIHQLTETRNEVRAKIYGLMCPSKFCARCSAPFTDYYEALSDLRRNFKPEKMLEVSVDFVIIFFAKTLCTGDRYCKDMQCPKCGGVARRNPFQKFCDEVNAITKEAEMHLEVEDKK